MSAMEPNVVTLSVPVGWYICYKSGTGRAIAYSGTYATREAAERVIENLEIRNLIHAVEVAELSK